MSNNVNGKFHKDIAELTRLAAAQIRVTVSESGESVDDLSKAFTDIVNQDRLIRESIQELPDIPEIQAIKKHITHLSSVIGSNVQQAIMAFQFYDRLCQRLDHTSECLKNLSELEENEIENSSIEVSRLRDKVYNHFTMEEERQLFDAVLSNKDFEMAIKEYTISRAESIATSDDDDDIELF